MTADDPMTPEQVRQTLERDDKTYTAMRAKYPAFTVLVPPPITDALWRHIIEQALLSEMTPRRLFYLLVMRPAAATE